MAEITRESNSTAINGANRRWTFGIRHLFALMTVISLLLVCRRFHFLEFALAVTFCLGYFHWMSTGALAAILTCNQRSFRFAVMLMVFNVAFVPCAGLFCILAAWFSDTPASSRFLISKAIGIVYMVTFAAQWPIIAGVFNYLSYHRISTIRSIFLAGCNWSIFVLNLRLLMPYY
jgi:hypothetical protein